MCRRLLGEFAGQAGDCVPLEAQRGYHVEYDMDLRMLSRPVFPTHTGFYVTPLQGRLRAAGTVELSSVHAPLNPRRISKLEKSMAELFPTLGTPTRQKLCIRPSLPDTLPVIGPSSGGGDVVYAFGHGHAGMTLGPITARMVADLVQGRGERHDFTPYSVRRFRLWGSAA